MKIGPVLKAIYPEQTDNKKVSKREKGLQLLELILFMEDLCLSPI